MTDVRDGRIARLRELLRESRERNTRLEDEIERLGHLGPDGDPDHARLVGRISILTEEILALRRQLADLRFERGDREASA